MGTRQNSTCGEIIVVGSREVTPAITRLESVHFNLHPTSPSASSVKTPLDIPLTTDVVGLVMVSSHRVSCAHMHVPSSIANLTRLQFYGLMHL